MVIIAKKNKIKEQEKIANLFLENLELPLLGGLLGGQLAEPSPLLPLQAVQALSCTQSLDNFVDLEMISFMVQNELWVSKKQACQKST